jgi:hypothetical protein
VPLTFNIQQRPKRIRKSSFGFELHCEQEKNILLFRTFTPQRSFSLKTLLSISTLKTHCHIDPISTYLTIMYLFKPKVHRKISGMNVLMKTDTTRLD